MDLSKVDTPVKGNSLIAFADIQGFLRIDKSISDPVALFDLLNEIARAAVNCVAKTSGEVVKFIGDAILLIFPGDDVDVGVGCLLELKAQIDHFPPGISQVVIVGTQGVPQIHTPDRLRGGVRVYARRTRLLS